ncbi:MAG: folylpolyglutamate synthase/dihydrofolate synthase family protein [Peptoniphilus sp.]|nr:folylpolyglutamate synthase/dihydrofolate synthase family protein [Peptoniphilus sp.]
MKLDELINNIESRVGQRKLYDLSRIRAMLDILGNPQKNMKYLHVAGTNGKGSTSNFLFNMLYAAGYKVGLTISPHIIRYNERIIVNDREISDHDFVRIGEIILAKEKQIEEQFGYLTYFEFITVIAFIYFKEQKCDYCVLEVGMGGMSDSTNVIDAKDKLLSLITPISMDHMNYIGNTIEEIATQKAGIIKKDSMVITSNKDERVLKIIREKAHEENCEYYDLDDIKIFDLKIDAGKSSYSISFLNSEIRDIKINLAGYYQIYNSALSVAGMLLLKEKELVDISPEEIKEGLLRAKWPGRMEMLSDNPRILVDGAHNVDGIDNLIKNLSLYEYDKLYIVTSILQDKEHEKILNKLSAYAYEIVLLDWDNYRKTEIETLKKEAQKYCQNIRISKDIVGAVDELKKVVKTDDLILITGSLYLVSEAVKSIKNNL